MTLLKILMKGILQWAGRRLFKKSSLFFKRGVLSLLFNSSSMLKGNLLNNVQNISVIVIAVIVVIIPFIFGEGIAT